MEHTYPTNVYWGDTHLHTNLSTDANGLGNRKLTPHDAYRFAKGETVVAHNGMKAKLHRPLDFLVIADHGANMGVMAGSNERDPVLLATETGKRWYEKYLDNPLDAGKILKADTDKPFNDALNSIYGGGPHGFFWGFTNGPDRQVVSDEQFRRSVWTEVIANAEHHNQPGKFTAFSGYEWTANTPAAIHRVVIFKDGANKVSQILPFTKYDSDDPESLWDFMSNYENKTDGEVIAIPHNSNLSAGFTFSTLNFSGDPLSENYAKARARWEPLAEVTQIKGDSETHPILSPTDEFADYETLNSWSGETIVEKLQIDEGWEKRKQAEYARSALKLGLQQQAELGVNPFKFGMIGSTDAHTSLPAIDEDNYWGNKVTLLEPSPYRIKRLSLKSIQQPWQLAASGYAAVWAMENTRESLFAAMKRKEVYATTGPRMTVRFFGGWGYKADDAFKPDFAKIGYAKGVPMGGDLTTSPKGNAPRFLIRAVKDPDGANLDRVQVIKGWRSKDGELHEKVYNVALSDGRVEDENGKAPPVGSTVNVADAFYINSIGDPELAVVWTDPDFNPNELAFYYVRVLEIPTPRWTAYDVKYFGLKDIPEEIPMITQERAYTSPIWFTP